MEQHLGHHKGIDLFQTEAGPAFRFTPNTPGIIGSIDVLLSLPERSRVGRDDDVIKKAIGAKKNSNLKVVDLTAGLLRDSFHLLQLGCHVTAIEENDLLAQAIDLLLPSIPKALSERLQFIHGTTENYLATLVGIKNFPDCIYFDPMFGQPDRKAGVGKETLLLQTLCKQSDPDRELSILKLAQTKVRDRVVVKRPILADPIGGNAPDIVYKGKAVRFDVYKAKRD